MCLLIRRLVTIISLHVLILGTLPDELGLLGLDCQSLDVSYNSITGPIPQSLLHMRNLVNLYLGPNLFTSIVPSGLNQLSNLVNLYINDCLLSGSIPQEVGNLNKLRTSAVMLLSEP
jgi:Leucine-rich repeat (LRR) protein